MKNLVFARVPVLFFSWFLRSALRSCHRKDFEFFSTKVFHQQPLTKKARILHFDTKVRLILYFFPDLQTTCALLDCRTIIFKSSWERMVFSGQNDEVTARKQDNHFPLCRHRLCSAAAQRFSWAFNHSNHSSQISDAPPTYRLMAFGIPHKYYHSLQHSKKIGVCLRLINI